VSVRPQLNCWLPVCCILEGAPNALSYDRGGGPKMKEITAESPGDNHHGQVLGTSGHMRMSPWTALPAGKESKLSMPFYLHLLTLTDDVYGSVALCFIASNTNFCLSLKPNHGPQLG
jgi:hypothetical protein